RHLADDADSESRSREWLTEYKIFRNSQLQSCLAHLIFKQISQGLDDFFEINIVRKSAYVVVRFDHCGLAAQTAFNYIRINGSLCQEIHSSDLLCLFLKHADEF